MATIENKDKQLLYPIGIDDLFIVMWSQSETVGAAPVFDKEIWRLPNIVKLGIKGNGSTKDKWASNKLFARVSRETQHELSLDHVAIPIAIWDQMKGAVSKNGVSFSKSTPKEMPYFAIGAIGPLSNGEKSAFWYPKVQLAIAEEHEYETTTEDMEIKEISCTMTATSLLINDVIKADYNSVRSSVTDMTVEKFMSEVIYDESQVLPNPAVIPVTGLEFSPKTSTADAGTAGNRQITATVLPENATNKIVTYSITPETEGLAVSETGNITWTETVPAGSYETTGTTEDGNLTDSNTLVLTPPS